MRKIRIFIFFLMPGSLKTKQNMELDNCPNHLYRRVTHQNSDGRAEVMNQKQAKQSNDEFVKQFCNILNTLTCWLCISTSTHAHTLRCLKNVRMLLLKKNILLKFWNRKIGFLDNQNVTKGACFQQKTWHLTSLCMQRISLHLCTHRHIQFMHVPLKICLYIKLIVCGSSILSLLQFSSPLCIF